MNTIEEWLEDGRQVDMWWALGAAMLLHNTGAINNNVVTVCEPFYQICKTIHESPLETPIENPNYTFDVEHKKEHTFTTHHNVNGDEYACDITILVTQHTQRWVRAWKNQPRRSIEVREAYVRVNGEPIATVARTQNNYSLHTCVQLNPENYGHITDPPTIINRWYSTEWGYYTNNGMFVSHRPNGVCNESYREDSDLYNQYQIHNIHAANRRWAKEACDHATTETRLRKLVKHKCRVTAYLAAHNKNCPDDVRVEYMLTRGHDFDKEKGLAA